MLLAPAGTVTETGNVTTGSLLARFTLNPPEGALLVRVTVQAAEPGLAIIVGLQEMVLSAATDCCRVIVPADPVDGVELAVASVAMAPLMGTETELAVVPDAICKVTVATTPLAMTVPSVP